ncbi:hypothetical protein A4X13_0g6016 [Tilletia indica]|uniref:DNA recombination and repair protein Rad51-like C-terminal domain-containing protein n=1 Tax=Tilletia indica TaxID=43049 RepID=A0A177TMR2_9BASI|nr:hypothetical protein A4X13_0g6016 [Tilletia indica]
MNSLSSLLSFGTDSSSQLPPVSTYVAVTDTLASSGSFIPISLARTMLLASTRSSNGIGLDPGEGSGTRSSAEETPAVVVWLGCDGSGEAHWRTLLRKAGVNAQAQTRLKYIDAVEFLLASNETGLKDLLEATRSALQSNTTRASTQSVGPARALVVVDNLSTMAWSLPIAPSKVTHQLSRWIRALRAVVEENDAALCTVQHASATSLYADANAQDSTDDDLLRHLLSSAEPDVWVEIRGLRSGRAKDCDGEIVIRPLLRPQLSLAHSRQGGNEGQALSAFALPNLSVPPRAFLFRIGLDPTARLAASSSSRVGQVEDWKGIQLWARGMMQGSL